MSELDDGAIAGHNLPNTGGSEHVHDLVQEPLLMPTSAMQPIDPHIDDLGQRVVQPHDRAAREHRLVRRPDLGKHVDLWNPDAKSTGYRSRRRRPD